MTKLNKPLIVAGVLFFVAQLSLGMFSAFADDPERGLAREWLEKAKAANAAYRWSDAISCADKAIQIRADYAEAYNERGIAHYQQNQLDKAVADFDTTVKLKPDFAAAYRTRGLTKADLGLFDGAFEDEDMAIKLSPKDIEAYNNKAALYHRQKLYDNAIAEYGQSLKINSDNFGAYRGRGNSYFRKGEYDRAIQDYGKAITLNSDDSNLYFFRARAYLGKGEHNLAVKDIKKALLLDPGNDKFKQKLAKLEGKTPSIRVSDRTSEGVNVLLMAPGYNMEWEGTKDRDSIQDQFKYIFFPSSLEEIVEVIRKLGHKEKIRKLVFLGHGDPAGDVIDLGDGVGFGSGVLDSIAGQLRKEGDSSVLDAFAENAEIIYLNCMAGLKPRLLTSTAELFLAFSGGTVYGSEQLVRSDLSVGNTLLTMLSNALPFLAEAVNFTSPSQIDYHTFWNRSLPPFPYRDFKAQQKVVIKGPDSVRVNEKVVLEAVIPDQKSIPAEIRPFLKYVWKSEKPITVKGKKRLEVRRDIHKDNIVVDTSAPATWRVDVGLFLDNGIGARKLGSANHILFVEQEEGIGIDLSSKDIIAGETFTARAYVRGGEAPKDAMWVWKGEGGVQIEQRKDNTVDFKAAGDGLLSVQLVSIGIFGKEKILGEAGIPIKPGSAALVKPVWKLEFNPREPFVGQVVTAEISPDTGNNPAELDMKEMNYRWQLSGNARQTGTSRDDSQITFYLTDIKTAKILCLASTKYKNENLGGVGKTISAQAYNITIIGPRPRQKLKKWQSHTQLGGASSTGMREAESRFVVGQEILFSSKIEPAPEKPVSYDWTVSPEDCTLTSNGGSDTSIICSSAASYTIKVTARMDGMEIGSAKAKVSVSAPQSDIAGTSEAKETPDWVGTWEDRYQATRYKENPIDPSRTDRFDNVNCVDSYTIEPYGKDGMDYVVTMKFWTALPSEKTSKFYAKVTTEPDCLEIWWSNLETSAPRAPAWRIYLIEPNAFKVGVDRNTRSGRPFKKVEDKP